MGDRRHSPDRRPPGARLCRLTAAAAAVLCAWPGLVGADEAGEAPARAGAAVSRPVGPPSPPVAETESWVRRFYAPVLRVSPEVLDEPGSEAGAPEPGPAASGAARGAR